MVSWTKTREPAVQSWPVLYRIPSAAQFAAVSGGQRTPRGQLSRRVSLCELACARRATRTLVEVRTFKDELRRLAAEFKRHLLQVAVRSRGHDLPARDGAAGEGDLVDALVRRERRAADGAQRDDRVDDARWDAIGPTRSAWVSRASNGATYPASTASSESFWEVR